MATDITLLLPLYVQSQLPNTCSFCGSAMMPVQFTTHVEEITRGDTPYHTTVVGFDCVPPCASVCVQRYIDYQRTEPI